MSPRLFWKRHHANTLNAVCFCIGAAWLGFQIAGAELPILNIALQATFGVWLTNLAYEQRNRDERRDVRIERLEAGGSKTTERVEALEAVAPTHATARDLLGVLERELATNRAALQSMREAITAKTSAGVPVLPETHRAIKLLERQIRDLAAEVEQRRAALANEELSEGPSL